MFVCCSKQELRELENTTENLILESRSLSPEVTDGKLSFPCPTDFVDYVNRLDEASEDEFLRISSSVSDFQSLWDRENTRARMEQLADHPGFASSLNQNGAIIIGSFLFKLNFESQEVYAIPTISRNHKAVELAENSSELPNETQVFSFGDNVFAQVDIPHCDIDIDVIPNDHQGSCENAPTDFDFQEAACEVTLSNGSLRRDQVVYKVVYDHFGIFWRIYVAAKADRLDPSDATDTDGFIKLDIVLYYRAYYRKGCDKLFSRSGTMQGHFRHRQKSIYSGFRALSAYNATARAVFTSNCDNGLSPSGPTAKIFHF